MANPHDHTKVIAALRETAKEIASMPTVKTIQPVIVEPELFDEPMPAEEEFDLDAELARISSQIAEDAAPVVVPDEPLSPEAMLREQILALLEDHPDKPSVAQINAWKDKYGQEGVQVLALDSQNVYVFTHLIWSQWERVQKLSETIQKQGAGGDAEKAMREAIVRAAVLWPKLPPDFFQKCHAGLPSTLMDQIMIASYFLSPQQAMALTTRL